MSNQKKIFYYIIVPIILLIIIMSIAYKYSLSKIHTHVPMFEDVTKISGIDLYKGPSYSAAWGDFNGDKYPDLWVSNHSNPPNLFINDGDGTFTEISKSLGLDNLHVDMHGSAWADFDNDGDQDLIQLVGGGRGYKHGKRLSNLLFQNNGGKFNEIAASKKIDYSDSRGRNPLWLDYDRDGDLDLFIGASKRKDYTYPFTIFRNDNEIFVDTKKFSDLNKMSVPFGILSDVNGDSIPNLLFFGSLPSAYRTDSFSFEKLKLEFLNRMRSANDAVLADFNGDLKMDIIVIKTLDFYPQINQIKDDLIRCLFISDTVEKGISFETSAPFSIYLDKSKLRLFNFSIIVGNKKVELSKIIQILPEMKIDSIRNIKNDDFQNYIRIYYDKSENKWNFLSKSKRKTVHLFAIKSDNMIQSTDLIGIDLNLRKRKNYYYMNTDSGFINISKKSGINKLNSNTRGIVVGDFDNDMDLDIYLVKSNSIKNLPNIILYNNGSGLFEMNKHSYDAAGTMMGASDFAISADYNNDGFIDLFLSNGLGNFYFIPDTTYQLFMNKGNNNNWIEIDLEGTNSNRDGIGAKVYVFAGGKTQLREQNGGIQSRAQNIKRLHYGLGKYTIIDSITVVWPSGNVQKLKKIKVNQIIKINESSGLVVKN
jgi:ASPIC and UnbV/FG-GAP-like repeat